MEVSVPEAIWLSSKEIRNRIGKIPLCYIWHISDHYRIDAEHGDDDLKVRSSFSPWPHVFNLANCIVGVSVLAMPFVFHQVRLTFFS